MSHNKDEVFRDDNRALKFGKETRTPAMQAGLAKKQLTLRDVFCSRVEVLRMTMIVFVVRRGYGIEMVAA